MDDNTNDTERLDATNPGRAEAAAEQPNGRSRSILTGTVVWGVILLIVAALYALQAAMEIGFIGGIEVSPAWVILGVGGLLVVGGLAAALTRRR